MLYANVLKRLTLNASLALLVVFTGCKKAPEPTSHAGPSLLPTPTQTAAAQPALQPNASPVAPPAEITWVDPPTWKRAERPSPMRKATYTIPHVPSEKEDAELGVFYFGPGQGGGIDANVDRWVKQFSDVPVEKVKRADRSAHGLVQHTVEIESGTFNAASSMMGGGQPKLKTGHALLGAIVEAPSGAYFFKLTGPAATVAAAKKAFYDMLDSVAAKS